MSFQISNFPAPSGAEIKSVIALAKSNPMDLDGRELWILREFIGGDF